ncbi:MAG: Ig-like domain-containing protein [Stenotrophobium sp.]
MKAFRLLAVLTALIVAGCGQGSVHSPDFRAVLTGITIAAPASNSPASVPIGGTVALTATGTYTTPPGSAQSSTTGPVSAAWHSDNAGVATVDGNGVVTGVTRGTANITATSGGFTSNSLPVTVTPPILKSVVIVDPADTTQAPETTKSITLGSAANFEALGVYSDSPTPRSIDTSSPIAWATVPTPSQVASVSPATGNETTATSQSASNGGATGTINVTASVTDANNNNNVVIGSVSLTVTASTLTGLAPAVILNPPQIAPTFLSQATAVGTYQDGSQHNLPNDGSAVAWSSSDQTIATIDAVKGDATGVAKGQATITATLNASIPSSSRTATGILTVTDPSCPNPLLASNGATASDATSGICLLCGTSNDSNIIDGNFDNFATMSVPVGLLTGAASVTVKSASPITPVANQSAGFIIGRPAGALVLAEIMSQIQINTLLNGKVQESTSATNALRLDLLGMELTGANSVALSSLPVTKPFDSLQLVFNSGLATALSSLQVYQACATAVPAAH